MHLRRFPQFNLFLISLPAVGSIFATVAVLACTASSHAETLEGLSTDAEVRRSGAGDAGGTIVNLNAGELFLGNPSQAAGPVANPVYVFQIPDLGPYTNPFQTVTFSVSLTTSTTSFAGYNADLYGLPARTSPDVLPGDAFVGPSDITSATLVRDNWIALNTSSPVPTGLRSLTSPELAAYLNAQYAGGAGAGKFVFIRISPDAAGNSWTNLKFASAQYSDTASRPSLTYTRAELDLYVPKDLTVQGNVDVSGDTITFGTNPEGSFNALWTFTSRGGTMLSSQISDSSGGWEWLPGVGAVGMRYVGGNLSFFSKAYNLSTPLGPYLDTIGALDHPSVTIGAAESRFSSPVYFDGPVHFGPGSIQNPLPSTGYNAFSIKSTTSHATNEEGVEIFRGVDVTPTGLTYVNLDASGAFAGFAGQITLNETDGFMFGSSAARVTIAGSLYLDPGVIRTPYSGLTVESSIEYSSTAMQVREIGAETPHFYVGTSGNVGVGTSNPTEKLEVNGNVKVNGVIRIQPAGDLSMGDFKADPTNP